MRTLTIDRFGRVIIPIKVRQQLGLSTSAQLNWEVENGKLILSPLPENPSTSYEGGVLVVEAEPLGNLETAVADLRNEGLSRSTDW